MSLRSRSQDLENLLVQAQSRLQKSPAALKKSKADEKGQLSQNIEALKKENIELKKKLSLIEKKTQEELAP
jgi:hypothetical protein